MAGRNIRNVNPDPVAQFNARALGYNFRDAWGLPLGNFLGHSSKRLETCYAALEATRLAVRYARVGPDPGLPRAYRFFPTGSPPQDWQGAPDYPAAHCAPTSLRVGNPASVGPRPRLQDVYADGISRAFVENLFGQTELVHRLTNYADQLCEGTWRRGQSIGMRYDLARSCDELVIDERASPREVFYDLLVPSFRASAQRELNAFEERIDADDPEAGRPSPLVDRYGDPFQFEPERADTRVSDKAPPDVQLKNQLAVVQVLTAYVETPAPSSSRVEPIAGQFKALASNEERLARD